MKKDTQKFEFTESVLMLLLCTYTLSCAGILWGEGKSGYNVLKDVCVTTDETKKIRANIWLEKKFEDDVLIHQTEPLRFE